MYMYVKLERVMFNSFHKMDIKVDYERVMVNSKFHTMDIHCKRKFAFDLKSRNFKGQGQRQGSQWKVLIKVYTCMRSLRELSSVVFPQWT